MAEFTDKLRVRQLAQRIAHMSLPTEGSLRDLRDEIDKLLAEPEPTEEVEVKELQRGDYIYHNPAGILCRMIEVPGIGLMAIPMDEGIIPVAYRLGPHKVLRIIRRQVESARETPPGTHSFKRGACTF